MPEPISLRKVAQELEGLMEQTTACINRQTGEIYFVSDDDAHLLEDDTASDNMPEWQQEMRAQLHEVLNDEDWVPLATKF